MSGKNRLCIVKRKFFDVRRGKPEGWIFGIADRRTADAAAVSQKIRELSERKYDGGGLKNNCSKRDFVRCPEKTGCVS